MLSKNKARRKFAFSFMALIDLFAILPFYLPMILPIDLRFLRMVRITRLMRVLKINRYSKALTTIFRVISRKKEELLATVFVMGFVIMISATLMYYFENEIQPEVFPNIVSSLWWAIATLTTVGYGDVYPVTFIGKVLASVIAVSGIGLVALPTGIISSGFVDELGKKPEDIECPHCMLSDELLPVQTTNYFRLVIRLNNKLLPQLQSTTIKTTYYHRFV